jgi:hypothetical protein
MPTPSRHILPAAAATAALLLHAATPAQDPAAADILRRHLDHTDGRHTFATANTFTYEGTLDDGNAVQRYRAFVRTKPFAFRQEVYAPDASEPALVRITDGRHVWSPDPAAPTKPPRRGIPLPGPAARAVLETAFFDGFVYLAHENFARRCAAAPPTPLPPHPTLHTSAAAQPAHPILFLAPGGATVQAWFHRDDGRLLGLDAPFPNPSHSVRCDDWRDFGPIRLPAIRREGAPNQPTFTLTITDFHVGPTLADALFAGCPAEPLPELLDAAAIEPAPSSIPGASHFLVPDLRVGPGLTIHALLDTGADSVYLSAPAADRLRLPVLARTRARGTAGSADVTRRWLDSLQIGAFRALQVEVSATLLPGLPQLAEHRQPAMVLGGDRLFEHSPVFDLQVGRLLLRGSPVRPLAELHAAEGRVVVLPLSRKGPRALPEVAIGIGGSRLTAMLDSGLHVVLLLTPKGMARAGLPLAADAWRARGAVTTRTSGAGANVREDLLVQIDQVDLGPVRFQRPWVLLQLAAPEAEGDEMPWDAVLGGGALLPFTRVGLDDARGRLELERSPRLRKEGGRWLVPEPGTFLGLVLAPGALGARAGPESLPHVIEVAPGTAAAAAGIAVGDRLAALGGSACDGVEPGQLNERFWLGPGERVELELVRRGGERVRVTLP